MADTDILVSEMTPASQINTTDLMIMTQPDAQAETGYSTKSGTVLQVANKMLKGTEYSTDLPDFTDKTPLGGLEELKADIKALLPVDSASGNPCNFETNLADNLVSLKASILASGGNGTPSTPIPIVGHSELNLVRCGVNQWDEVIELGGFEADGSPNARTDVIRSKNYIPCNESTNYYIKQGTLTDSAWSYFVFYDSSKTVIGSRTTVYGSILTPVGARYMRFQLNTSYGTTYGDNVSINYPSTDTSYHAYNGTPYLVQFGQTVYGGVYDANGKIEKTFDDSNLSDITGWSYANGFFRTLALASIIKKPASQSTASRALCSIYNSVSWNACGDNDFEFAFNSSNGELIIKDIRYTDVPSFLAGVSGISLVYELATPIEIDVSELSVDTIVGVNNIVSDCGGDVEVGYRDSIQHYIDKKIAETQALIL